MNNKDSMLHALYTKYTAACIGSGLAQDREQFVFGCGPADCGKVLIGEAPGRDEVNQGIPFVGQAGQKLNENLIGAGIRREDVFVTNSIKYRLGKVNEKTGRTVNRPATAADIKFNVPWLARELELLAPRIVITLGNVPLKIALGDGGANIGEMHGRPLEGLLKCGAVLFPMYHPASLIYNRELEKVYAQDFRTLKTYLEGK